MHTVQQQTNVQWSHELRAPLVAAQQTLAILQSTPLNAEQRRLVAQLAIANEVARHSVDLVIDAEIFRRKGIAVVPVVFDLFALMRCIVALGQPIANRKGLAFRWHVHSPVRWLVGDMHLLRVSLENIVANAVKYTLTGSVTVVLQVWRGTNGDQLRAWIQDTGPGFDCSDGKVSMGAVVDWQSSGLGLANAQAAIELLHGSMRHEGTVTPHGTRFTLVAPIEVATEPLANTGLSAGTVENSADLSSEGVHILSQSAGIDELMELARSNVLLSCPIDNPAITAIIANGLTQNSIQGGGRYIDQADDEYVLVCDDEPTSLAYCAHLLREAGLKFKLVTSLEEMRGTVTSGIKVNALIADRNALGGELGTSHQHLAKTQPKATFVLMSADRPIVLTRECEQSGIADTSILQKPFTSDELLRAINRQDTGLTSAKAEWRSRGQVVQISSFAEMLLPDFATTVRDTLRQADAGVQRNNYAEVWHAAHSALGAANIVLGSQHPLSLHLAKIRREGPPPSEGLACWFQDLQEEVKRVRIRRGSAVSMSLFDSQDFVREALPDR